LGLLLAALLLAACGSPPPPVVNVLPPQPSRAWGIDLAIDTQPYANAIRDSRIQFVARYYRDPASHWPALTAAEARQLSAAGLALVAIFESHSANPAYFSYARGYWDAVTAAHEAAAVGQPAGSAIYFGVDFNARDEALERVKQYFTGVEAAMAAAGPNGKPAYKIGVYGSGVVCGAIKDAGLAQYAWLTNSTAWDGVLGYQDWNIRQHREPAGVSFSADSDEAVGEYGAFQVAGAEAAALVSAATPPVVAADQQQPQQQPLETAATGNHPPP
jgi:peptidoglycan hydrolase-like protein with peptidoglycan-binding domain